MITRITSKFGAIDAVHKTPHTGIDIAMPSGTKLRALSDGVVDRVFTGDGPIGKGLSIKFPDGTRAIYGHMNDVKAQVGEVVNAGDIIGLSGSTGRSTGPHLHLGLKAPDGSWLDPSRMLANGKVADGIGDVPYFSIWEWLYGKVSEFAAQGAVDNAADYIADFALAFPILAVVGGCMYALINMLSKGAAKWGALATILYGMCVIK
jgi:murein DD-endopeptidase MepM/ murein hydrolase activator NlpD